MSRALAPQLTFADLEFIRLGVFLDPRPATYRLIPQ
jgi:hypothetical protein